MKLVDKWYVLFLHFGFPTRSPYRFGHKLCFFTHFTHLGSWGRDPHISPKGVVTHHLGTATRHSGKNHAEQPRTTRTSSGTPQATPDGGRDPVRKSAISFLKSDADESTRTKPRMRSPRCADNPRDNQSRRDAATANESS